MSPAASPTCSLVTLHLGHWLDGPAHPGASSNSEAAASKSAPPAPHSELASHLASCSHCKERLQRWQLLSATLATQSRTPLPQALRKTPFAAIVTRADFKRAPTPQTAWERIPWYLRATLEGTGIVALILIAISAGPRIRAIYERGVERSLQEYGELLVGDDKAESTDGLPRATTPLAKLAEGGPTASENRDEFSGEAEGEDESSDDTVEAESLEQTYVVGDTGQKVRVGKSEIWRFMIKSDSPADLRRRVVSMLSEQGVPSSTQGLGGTLAPGGIQFDLFLSPSYVPRIKAALQKLATPRNPEIPISEAFTWYKSRSRRKIPDGKVRVVIWLSQV